MKRLALFTFLLLFGGALQAQHADCRVEKLASDGTTSFVECETPTEGRYAVEVLSLNNEPVLAFTTTNIPNAMGRVLLPKGVFRVRIIQDGILISEEIRTQE